MVIHELPNKNLKYCLKETQWAIREQSQRNKIRKMINEQNEQFNKGIESIRKKQTEILELKNWTEKFCGLSIADLII